MTDIPDRHERTLHSDVAYPQGCRYTLQWLVDPDEWSGIKDHSDATFAHGTLRTNMPADLLLHYTYGAAAAKRWGRNLDVLMRREGIQRPPPPEPRVMRPPRSNHDRTETIMQDRVEGNDNDRGVEEDVGPVHSSSWDGDEIVLFFWASSQVSRERRARKEQERREYMEQWRSGVSNA